MIKTLPFTKDKSEIVKTVLYFDVFKYPLTSDELFENSAIGISKESFMAELGDLLDNKVLRREGDFILSAEGTKSDIQKRLNGNAGARKIMPIAYKYSRKIASFPFVEGVCLSGGLSKNYFDEDGDIDFFIITKPNRLWICRSLLILKYKTLSKQAKKYWCTNYFISSGNLSIPDINVFAGTELAFLIPSVNYSIYIKLLEQNNWYKNRFPNKQELSKENCLDIPDAFFKNVIENSLKGKFGQWLDEKLLNITLKRWRKKYPDMDDKDFDLQFRSRKDVCKRHTHGFQNKVLVLWRNKKEEFEKKFNVSLTD
jgi:hypothetical protein